MMNRPTLSDFLARTVVADPPWTPSLHANNPRRATLDKAGPQKHYETLSLEAIISMGPETEDQAHLWLWVINQHVDWGYEVARAWGFEPQQMITWKKPGLGAGRFQSNTESCLICRKGQRQGNPFGMTGGTGVDWPRGRHSEKPDQFYRLVEKVSPGPYLEMFCRRPQPGWMVHGNQINEALPLFRDAA
jgi:N6-adenosine-specific RNA methylase IME4